jgi:hypothetical protein
VDRNQSYLEWTLPKDWTLIAALDESQSYEVDVTEIWKSPDNKFQLVTATGCSCWGGEYEAEPFDTLESLGESMIKDDRQYNPSFAGAKMLLSQAQGDGVVASS